MRVGTAAGAPPTVATMKTFHESPARPLNIQERSQRAIDPDEGTVAGPAGRKLIISANASELTLGSTLLAQKNASKAS